MKTTLLSLVVLLIAIIAYSQKTKYFGRLKRPDEQVIFSFRLKNSNKTALLCRQKNNRYLVYRFGTEGKIELQYPAILTATSWKEFKYDAYTRGGGPENSAEVENLVAFINNGTRNKLYENRASIYNEKGACGLIVEINGRKKQLNGNSHSETGTLGSLDDYNAVIPNSYWNDNQ